MTVDVVKDSDIEAVEKLGSGGEFSLSLSRTQVLLGRNPEDGARIRLLFNVLYCSTRLELDQVTASACRELDLLPQPEISRIFVNLIRAMSYIELGRAQDALLLINANLETAFMDRDDFRIHKYDHLAAKGKALTRLHQWEEAVTWLTKASSLYPEENGIKDPEVREHVRWRTTSMLCDMVASLGGLKRYDEAFETANQLRNREKGDLNTVAIHYMATCRLSQQRFFRSNGSLSPSSKEAPVRFGR